MYGDNIETYLWTYLWNCGWNNMKTFKCGIIGRGNCGNKFCREKLINYFYPYLKWCKSPMLSVGLSTSTSPQPIPQLSTVSNREL